MRILLSGRQDSNLRPPGPKPGALPGCATPRCKNSEKISLFCGCKGSYFFRVLQIFSSLFYYFQLLEYLCKSLHTSFHLLLRMTRHKSKAHERILRCTCRRNYRVDKHTGIKSHLRDKECLVNIVNIQRDDGTFSVSYLKTLFTETAQRIFGHLPQCLQTLRFALQNVQSLHCGCRCARNPPILASDLENVPIIRSTSSVSPKWSQTPLPSRPNTPTP